MKKFISYFAIALCSIFTLISCDKDEIAENKTKAKLSGTWEWVSTTYYNPHGSTKTENADKYNWANLTVNDKVIEYQDKSGKQALTYTLDGKNIYIGGGILIWEIEKLTNKKLKFKASSVFDSSTYQIDEYKRK